MSTFAGLSTALSSLIAQRQSLNVTGQNIANANTAGYTRQRADLASVQALTAPSMFSAGLTAGNGVRLSGIARLGDMFLDARVRAETGSASFAQAQAGSLGRLQSTIAEPTGTGLAAGLQGYWAAWQDVSNRPDDAAARKVLLGSAEQVVTQLAAGYRAVEAQWTQQRTEVQTLTTDVNSLAGQVAHLNDQIRAILVSGGSANELMDQRDLHVTTLAGLVGATARHREDGTLDVMVGGNALVRGVHAHEVAAHGSFTMSGGTTGGDRVRLVWASTGTDLVPDGGRLASHLADLAPSGMLADAAATWNGIATSLADSVNTLHLTGAGLDGATGRAFFSFEAGPPAPPAAVGLRVAVTDPAHVAAAVPGQGTFDGSLADAISQRSTAADGPDVRWKSFVVDLGVRTRAAEQRAAITENARATAANLQLAQTSVDLDEETVTMLATQRAYEGAARVLTAIDEMLDVLINRTGVVGR
jgi:flagellar hook-associated protein 1